MLSRLSAKKFAAVSHLETSKLMLTNPEGLVFSTDKPNVIVGPNGSGKSACMTTLALHTHSYFCGKSALDSNYIQSRHFPELWLTKRAWGADEHFYLDGLTMEGDAGAALFYRPNMLPGNTRMIAEAMMSGYCEEGKEYGRLTKHKSSGEASSALLNTILAVLKGEQEHNSYEVMNWGYGSTKLKAPSTDRSAQLIENYNIDRKNLKPVVLLDEPEQSLDALAELKLWHAIENINADKVQVIVATHSLYPIMNQDRFNIIEAEPGYLDSVLSLLNR